jgi:hypothetical protein
MCDLKKMIAAASAVATDIADTQTLVTEIEMLSVVLG